MRIGQGFDAHALVAGRKLVIGGVAIPHDKGLAGHSDADVLIHAVCDALLGAAGLGDIGGHFPDSDARYKDIDSRRLLREVARLLRGTSLRHGRVFAMGGHLDGVVSFGLTASAAGAAARGHGYGDGGNGRLLCYLQGIRYPA